MHESPLLCSAIESCGLEGAVCDHCAWEETEKANIFNIDKTNDGIIKYFNENSTINLVIKWPLVSSWIAREWAKICVLE